MFNQNPNQKKKTVQMNSTKQFIKRTHTHTHSFIHLFTNTSTNCKHFERKREQIYHLVGESKKRKEGKRKKKKRKRKKINKKIKRLKPQKTSTASITIFIQWTPSTPYGYWHALYRWRTVYRAWHTKGPSFRKPAHLTANVNGSSMGRTVICCASELSSVDI